MNLGCIDRTPARGETSPARDLVVDRTVHKTSNIFQVAYSHPTPSGVRTAFMLGRDREVEETRIYKSHLVTGRARVDDEPIRDRDGILELNRLVPPLDAVFEVVL